TCRYAPRPVLAVTSFSLSPCLLISVSTMNRPPTVDLMRKLGLEPDPWQVEVLEADYPRLLLNCCRQAGKSTAVALLGLAEAVFVPFTKVLLVSRSLRQSQELFRIVTDFYCRIGAPIRERQTACTAPATTRAT